MKLKTASKLISSSLVLTCASVGYCQPEAAGYSITTRGQNDRVWSKVTAKVETDGSTTLVTNSYVEVATSMHYWEDNHWKESQDLIELTGKGGAAALRGPWKAYFESNLAGKGAIRFLSPQGRRIETRPLGLFYHDMASDQVVQIADLRDCSAELLPPNQIVWKGIFDTIDADWRVTYTKAAIECDLILKERPKPPGAYPGLDPATTRLELWHEWHGAPTPQKRQVPLGGKSAGSPDSQTPELVDHILDFGEAVFHAGRAFILDEPVGRSSDTAAEIQLITQRNPDDVPVGKDWYDLPKMGILVEAVNWQEIEVKLEELPEMAQVESPAPRDRQLCLLDAGKAEESDKSGRPIEIASNSYNPKGLVQDLIVTINSSGPNYTFQTYTTYDVQYAYFGGTVTLNYSAYLKFPASGFGLRVYGNLICNGSRPSPTIFTSKDDDLYGEVLPSSNHNPTYSGAKLNIYFPTSTVTIKGVKIRWAQTAIDFNSNGTDATLSTSLLEYCNNGIHASTADGTMTLSAPPFESRHCEVVTLYAPENINFIVGSMTDSCVGETDTDADGLPNWWEVKYFGSTTIAEPGADSDFDCTNNLTEKQLASNPRDAIQPFSITSQPTPTVQRLNPGNSVTYSVRTMPACPSFQWFRNGAAIAGATSSTYTLNNVGVNDDGARFEVRPTIPQLGTLYSSTAQIAVLNSFWSSLWDYYMKSDRRKSDVIWNVRSAPVSSATQTPQLQWSKNSKLYGKTGFTAISGNNYHPGSSPEYIPYTLLTKRHAYMRGHGAGVSGLHTDWGNRKVWFCTAKNSLVEARVREGYVHYGLGDGLDFTVVIFQNDVTNSITPMSVMVPPANYVVAYHIHYIHTINNTLNTAAISDSQPWNFGGNSGSPIMIARTDGSLVFFGGVTTSGPSIQPGQPGTDPIQADIDLLTTRASLNANNYRLTWYVP